MGLLKGKKWAVVLMLVALVLGMMAPLAMAARERPQRRVADPTAKDPRSVLGLPVVGFFSLDKLNNEFERVGAVYNPENLDVEAVTPEDEQLHVRVVAAYVTLRAEMDDDFADQLEAAEESTDPFGDILKAEELYRLGEARRIRQEKLDALKFVTVNDIAGLLGFVVVVSAIQHYMRVLKFRRFKKKIVKSQSYQNDLKSAAMAAIKERGETPSDELVTGEMQTIQDKGGVPFKAVGVIGEMDPSKLYSSLFAAWVLQIPLMPWKWYKGKNDKEMMVVKHSLGVGIEFLPMITSLVPFIHANNNPPEFTIMFSEMKRIAANADKYFEEMDKKEAARPAELVAEIKARQKGEPKGEDPKEITARMHPGTNPAGLTAEQLEADSNAIPIGLVLDSAPNITRMCWGFLNAFVERSFESGGQAADLAGIRFPGFPSMDSLREMHPNNLRKCDIRMKDHVAAQEAGTIKKTARQPFDAALKEAFPPILTPHFLEEFVRCVFLSVFAAAHTTEGLDKEELPDFSEVGVGRHYRSEFPFLIRWCHVSLQNGLKRRSEALAAREKAIKQMAEKAGRPVEELKEILAREEAMRKNATAK